MQVPEKLTSFRVYRDGDDLIGIADVTLPSLEAMTETVKGAGIAGEIDSPVMGHFGSMELVLNWRTLEESNVNLASPTGVALDLRGAQQVYDSSAATFVIRPIKCVVRGVPKKTDLGKLDIGATTDTSNTIEVNYLKITIDGEDLVEIDKYNFICTIGDTDYMADIKSALGLS